MKASSSSSVNGDGKNELNSSSSENRSIDSDTNTSSDKEEKEAAKRNSQNEESSKSCPPICAQEEVEDDNVDNGFSLGTEECKGSSNIHSISDDDIVNTIINENKDEEMAYVHVPLYKEMKIETNQNSLESFLPQEPELTELDANYHEQQNINQKRLHQALSDAVHHSQGISAVEVWTLNERRTHIIRPEGAYYRDPNYKPPSHLNISSARLALMRLEDETCEDYHDVMPTEPGKGLAGQLWVDTKKAKLLNTSLSAFGSSHGSHNGVNLRKSRSLTDSLRRGLQAHIPHIFQAQHQAASHWTDLGFLFRDPDHVPDERLQSFILAGIGLAAGVAYNSRGYQGLVIFMARSDTPIDILQEESNATFLSCAADCIGAALAISEPRTSSLYLKRRYGDVTNKTNKKRRSVEDENALESGSFLIGSDQVVGNFSIDNMGISRTSSMANSNVGSVASNHGSVLSMRSRYKQSIVGATWHFVAMKANMLWEKSLGPKTARPPPPMSLPESVWTFIGCFASLSLISYLSYSIPIFKSTDSSDVFAFPMGPIGALVALQFGLTAAPASQPRNILYGTAIAGATGLCFGYFTAWPHWLRLALGTSTAITLTAKAGIINPPSGALAAIFCLPRYHWGHLLLSLFGCALSVILSMLINNLNEKRHYPMYWAVKPSCTKREI